MTGLVQPFISTVIGSLDSKGRVCIPATYRHILAAQSTAGVYVCPSFSEAALEAFGQTLLESVSARLANQDPFFSPNHDDQATAIIARTQLLVADDQGRVRLPDAMIAHAKLKDRIAFVGKSAKFQIWDWDTYGPVEAEAVARMKAKLERARGGKHMSGHLPVMLSEVIAALAPKDGAHYIDGTFGGGGYTKAILEAADCKVLGIDRDPEAIARGQALVERFNGRLTLALGEYSGMAALAGPSDGVVLDLGVSSFQFDTPSRGFSFREDGPLDMRMSLAGESAADFVNSADHSTLASVIARLGEEKNARRIASALIAARPVTTTSELAQIVSEAQGPAALRHAIHPATRTFQALRIHVNDELGELERGLEGALGLLKPAGRLAVVSFHSLEDRIVKQFFIRNSDTRPRGSRHLPQTARSKAALHLITSRPQTPGPAELSANPRSRSAKLRVAEKLAA